LGTLEELEHFSSKISSFDAFEKIIASIFYNLLGYHGLYRYCIADLEFGIPVIYICPHDQPDIAT
jgi:hypothetical protein